MRPATDADLEPFTSLRHGACPEGRFIADGARVVRRMLSAGAAERLVCTEDWASRLTIPPGVDVAVAPRERLESVVGHRLHQGVMGIGRIPDPGPVRGSLLLALDGLADAENVGAVMRNAAAFGADGVLVGPGTASPWLRRAVRTSLGAPLHVPVHPVDDLAEAVRPLNAWAAHIHGRSLEYTEVDLKADCCLVLGGEAQGVSPEVVKACRGVLRIPMAEEWDCVNVAASSAVLLAEVRRQRSAT